MRLPMAVRFFRFPKYMTATFALLMGVGATVCADEEKIALKDVPSAVMDAIKAKYPKAEFKEAAKETENGKTTFEITLVDNGSSVDVTATAAGKIVEIERVIAAKDLPLAVAKAIAAKYPKAEIKKAEMIVEYDGESKESKFYEVVLSADAKAKRELKLTPAGKILHDEADED